MSSEIKSCGPEVLYSLEFGEPPEDILQWGKKNMREDPDARDQKIDELRDMIYAQGECVPHRTDDAFLIRFLRGRNYSLDAAYALTKAYCDFKEKYPEIFDDVGLDILERIGFHDVLVVPPYREQTGRRMMIFKLGNWDPNYFEIDDVFRATVLILELAVLEQQAQMLGGVAIFDLDGLTMNQAWYMNPNVAYKVFQLMVLCSPLKIEAVHVVNQPRMFGMIYNFFKPLLNERINQRIFFHGNDMESLHQHISPKHLPDKYGGIHKNYDYRNWLNYFETDEHIVKELKSLGYIPYRTIRLHPEEKEKDKEIL